MTARSEDSLEPNEILSLHRNRFVSWFPANQESWSDLENGKEIALAFSRDRRSHVLENRTKFLLWI